MPSISETVCRVLAYHLNRDTETIHPSDDLCGDLRLTTLGLVLVIMDMEDITCVRFAIDDVASLRTVRDLTAFVAHAVFLESTRGCQRGIREARPSSPPPANPAAA